MPRKFILYFIIFLLISSCTNRQEIDRIRIKNYFIGSRIDTTDFMYNNYMDSAILVANYISNKNFTVFTWHDTIVWMAYIFNTKEEFDSKVKVISSLMKKDPEINQKLTKSIVNFQYYWLDIKTGDEISMGYSIDSTDKFSGGMMIENKRFIEKLIPQKDDEIKIVEFKE